jgi:translation initiation factor 2A
MNVDNAYSVFDYQGEELRTIQFEALYEVIIRPVSPGIYKDRSPSPSRRQPQVKTEAPKKLFVPPGGSGQLA